MTLVLTTENAYSPQLPWESLMAGTRYGKYADTVESRMIRYALTKQERTGALLDIGCEGGRWSKVFADRGWQVTALDVDPRALEIFRQRVSGASCVLVSPDQERFPVSDQSVDLALCIEVGPVIHKVWAAAEFERVLRRGGRLVGVCWNRNSWRGVLYHNAPGLRSAGSNPLVGFPIRYSDFKARMKVHGFRFEKECGYAWGPFRRTSNSRWMSVWAAVEPYSGLQRLVNCSPMVAFVCQKV